MNHGTRRHGRTVRRPVEPRRSTRRVPPPAVPRSEPRARRPKGLIWNGSISFGLVNIPVTLHSGENTKELHFTMLDSRDMSPIGYRKVNKSTGQDVPKEKIVKGYRMEDDRFVTLTNEDFKRASPERTQRIEISAFIDGSKLDPALFEKPYYLEPVPKNEKAYALLREAMKRTGKVGIATIVLRARQYIAALMAKGPVLMLEVLRYSEELRDPSELHLPPEDLKLGETELEMAEQLIERLSGPWEPESFKDDYHDELLAFIEKKAKAGKTLEAPAVPETRGKGTPPADIMALLKKSLEGRGKART
jgi:DNA end-binding protein Ku